MPEKMQEESPTTEPSGAVADSRVQEPLVAESLIEESLVDEASIDGMCGVY